jgi:hypothetical protein
MNKEEGRSSRTAESRESGREDHRRFRELAIESLLRVFEQVKLKLEGFCRCLYSSTLELEMSSKAAKCGKLELLKHDAFG